MNISDIPAAEPAHSHSSVLTFLIFFVGLFVILRVNPILARRGIGRIFILLLDVVLLVGLAVVSTVINGIICYL